MVELEQRLRKVFLGLASIFVGRHFSSSWPADNKGCLPAMADLS